jgi:probable F420-dependent oxidoreductase
LRNGICGVDALGPRAANRLPYDPAIAYPSGTGIWSGELRRHGDEAEANDAAAELEQLGYSALWLPGQNPDDLFHRLATTLRSTSTLIVASGILNIWQHDPEIVAVERAELGDSSDGRFLLGLGISHAALVDREEPGRYRRPIATMRAYLDSLDVAAPPVPPESRVLAALGPKMLELARDRSAGAHPYLVTPEHTHRAREALGPERLLAPEQAVVLETDPARARDLARGHLAIYLQLPNYTNNMRRLGFDDADFADGGSDRLVDALVVWGDEDAIATRVHEHREAGADHVCIQAVAGGDGLPRDEWRRLAPALV